jgi:hypothetical protein
MNPAPQGPFGWALLIFCWAGIAIMVGLMLWDAVAGTISWWRGADRGEKIAAGVAVLFLLLLIGSCLEGSIQ